jgi:hypothetical protein
MLVVYEIKHIILYPLSVSKPPPMVPPTSNSSMHVRGSDNKIWSGTLQEKE